jgi:hypothetical protein
MTTAAADQAYALTRSVNVDQVLAQRGAYAASLNAAAAAMRVASTFGDVRITLDRDRSHKGSTHHWPDQDAVDEMLRRHDAAAWWNLLKDIGSLLRRHPRRGRLPDAVTVSPETVAAAGAR